MSEIPKIVRQRLQQADDASVPHPDANVLTAFAESSLLPAERTSVLDHLSNCAECREVLAFALPAMEAGQAVLPVPRRSRLSWPTLRWAFVSAGIVALSVFGFLEYGHRDDSLKVAKNSSPPAAIHGNQSVAAPVLQDERSANECNSDAGPRPYPGCALRSACGFSRDGRTMRCSKEKSPPSGLSAAR